MHPLTPPPALRALLAAECAAEAAAPQEEEDLQQAVWLRWLECAGRDGFPPPRPAAWLGEAVREEARRTRRRAAREVPYTDIPVPRTVASADGTSDPAWEAEVPLLADERRRYLTDAVSRLPGRCPAVLAQLLNSRRPGYPEIARELGMSQGAVGPLRSRCLECLRRRFAADVAAAGAGGRVR